MTTILFGVSLPTNGGTCNKNSLFSANSFLWPFSTPVFCSTQLHHHLLTKVGPKSNKPANKFKSVFSFI